MAKMEQQGRERARGEVQLNRGTLEETPSGKEKPLPIFSGGVKDSTSTQNL
jgi:hypothetical protein